MRVLFASSPIIGHFNPTLVAARVLKDAGHETAFYTGRTFGERVEAAGIRFFPLPPEADYDMTQPGEVLPEMSQLAPGLPQMLYVCKALFVDRIPAQAKGLDLVLQEFHPDVIVYETSFSGVLPLLLGPRSARPACTYLGVVNLMLPREDGAPFGPGLPFSTDPVERKKYQAIASQVDAAMNQPLQEHANLLLSFMGLPELPAPFWETITTRADLLLQASVPGFEYPMDAPKEKLHFIGALMPSGSGDVPPELKKAKEVGKRILLVSQGTIANQDLGQLVAPAIEAFGDREDLLLLATTGGRPIDSIPCLIGKHTIVSEFLNFREVLPNVDVMITFGGYGTVTQTLSFGVPMVMAGVGEEKPENGARVVWRECGIYLPGEAVSVDDLKDAVETVLADPSYRENATRLAQEFGTHDAAQELVRHLEDLTGRL